MEISLSTTERLACCYKSGRLLVYKAYSKVNNMAYSKIDIAYGKVDNMAYSKENDMAYNKGYNTACSKVDSMAFSKVCKIITCKYLCPLQKVWLVVKIPGVS